MGEINGTFTGCDKCGCTIPGWHHVINGKTCPNMATETNATVIENGKLRSEVERLNAEIATLTDKYNAAIQQLADLNRHVAILETALKQSRDSILEAIWLYDELSMSPLEAAVKHGPDYTPPLDTDILAVREKLDKSRIFMRPTIEEIGGHMDATILNIYIQVQSGKPIGVEIPETPTKLESMFFRSGPAPTVLA